MLHQHITRSWRTKIGAGVSATIMSALGLGASVPADADPSVNEIRTATPIKHVIIIVGENRRFDHLFATYVPRSKEDRVRNLLSEKIINADGTPGPNFAKAHQFQITSAPNGGKFFSRSDLKNKTVYSVVPAPDIGGTAK